MFLSKLFMHRIELVDPYQYHKFIWELFPNREDDGRNFLYRVERRIPGQGVEILMQSSVQPQDRSENIELVASKEFEPRLSKNQFLRFKLRANPVKAIRDDHKQRKNGEHKIRVPLIREEQQVDWLIRKVKEYAMVESVIVRNEVPLYFYKRDSGRGKIQTVSFEGYLKVIEPDGVKQLLLSGIGPAKSFGCGMLSIAAG